MRRLARHAFTALSAFSLLLCVAVCVLWVRSFCWADGVFLHHSTGGDSVLVVREPPPVWGMGGDLHILKGRA